MRFIYKNIYIFFTSESQWNDWLADKYPILFKVNLLELITSIMLNPAQDMSYPNICNCKKTTVLKMLKNIKCTYISKFSNGIAFNRKIILSEFLFDIFHAFWNVFGLKKNRYANSRKSINITLQLQIKFTHLIFLIVSDSSYKIC